MRACLKNVNACHCFLQAVTGMCVWTTTVGDIHLVTMATCICCGNGFVKRSSGFGYQRRPVTARLRHEEVSVLEALQKLSNYTVSKLSS